MSEPSASRPLRWFQRGMLPLLTICLAVLLQSFAWVDDAPLILKAAIFLFALFSWWRPADGLLAVAGIAPISRLITARIWRGDGQITEAIVLAFLVGWLASGRRRGAGVPAPLAPALWLLIGVTSASLVTQAVMLQAWRNFPNEYFAELRQYLTIGYLNGLPRFWPTWAGGLGFLRDGLIIIESALLLWAAVALARTSDAFTKSLFRLTVISGIAASLLIGVEILQVYVSLGDGARLLPLLRARWAVHITKEVTASSHFLLIFFMALGAALVRRPPDGIMLASAAMLGASVWLTGSRVALATALVVFIAGVLFYSWPGRGPARAPFWRRAALVGALCVLFVALQVWRSPRRSTLEHLDHSITLRLAISEAGLRMAAVNPLFGVGPGEFRHKLPTVAPEIMKGRDELFDAHNNFVQVLAELGIVGFVPFVWLIGAITFASFRALTTDRSNPYLAGIVAGVSAFLITCLSGHPLVIGPVAYAFWIVLGIAWRLSVSPGGEIPPARTIRVAAAAVALFVVASIPVRAVQGIREGHLAVSPGFYDWESEPSGLRYRWIGPHARFFTPADAAAVEFSLQPYDVRAVGPVRVDIFLDDVHVKTVGLAENSWHTERLDLRPAGRWIQRRIDLLVSPTFVPATLIPGSNDPRVLGVKVGLVDIIQAQSE